MSLYSMQINFEKSKLPRNLRSEVTRIIGESFPEFSSNVSGTVAGDTNICWQGSMDEAIIVNVQTAQNLNATLNKKCVQALSQYLSEATGVPPNRIFINLLEKVYSDMAINGLLLWQSM